MKIGEEIGHSFDAKGCSYIIHISYLSLENHPGPFPSLWDTLFLYKNQLYKNKEAQNDPKFKNKLRTTPASRWFSLSHKHLFYLFYIHM